jgi:hypothetical protein
MPLPCSETEAISIRQHACAEERADGQLRCYEPQTDFEPLFLISFTWYPGELRRELVTGKSIAHIREALSAAGCCFETVEGAKIFCAVNQHAAVLKAIANCDVRPYQVVVSGICRGALFRTLAAVPMRRKVRVKRSKMVGLVPIGDLPRELEMASLGEWRSGACSSRSDDSCGRDANGKLQSSLEDTSTDDSIHVRRSARDDVHDALSYANQTFPVRLADQLEWRLASHRECLENWTYVNAPLCNAK